ncbi:MAG: hypothetical protein ABI794_12550 [Betaproteobacteria bacterium]
MTQAESTMSNRSPLALAVSFTIALFAVGIPYWQIPYAQVGLPNSICNLGLLITLVAPIWLRGIVRISFLKAVMVVGLAAPTAVILRIIVETSRDPTSHNLWPLEVILTGGVSLAVALAGAVLGCGLRVLLSRSAT